MADISTQLAGVKMRTPFGVSPHNLDKVWFPGRKATDLYKKYLDAGVGFIYIPAILPGEPSKEEINLDFPTLFKNQQYVGRWLRVKENRQMIGHYFSGKNLFNFLPWAEELINSLKPKLPKDVPIICQIIVHDPNPEAWAAQTEKVQNLEQIN